MVNIEAPPDPGDLCICGHPGYDGHDMRSVPPGCMTPGCPCGNTDADRWWHDRELSELRDAAVPESEKRALWGDR